MIILFFGDIVGRPGRLAVKKILPELEKAYEPDLILANCENLAHGKGVTRETLSVLRESGIEIFTSGNHVFNQKQAHEILIEKDSDLLRPANYPPGVPGRGFKVMEIGTKKMAVVNLVGRVFFDEDFDCPFRCADEILEELKEKKIKIILVDFHAEATSEAVALGWYLDGRVSLVAGTHTHIQTADERILSKGTAYITDIGMVGARDSVIGVDKDLVIANFLTQMPVCFEVAEGDVLVDAIICEIDSKTGRSGRIERIQRVVGA